MNSKHAILATILAGNLAFAAAAAPQPAPGNPPPRPVTLTVALAGSGAGVVVSEDRRIDCGTVCTAKLPSGAAIALQAKPANGSSFEGWSGALHGNVGTATIQMNESQTLQAAFAKNPTQAPTVGGTIPPQGVYNMALTLSDGAQRSTLAFDGLALITGNLAAQSFFPPGKIADYTGFQYLRDNDPDNMGHNTDFLTRVAHNVIYVLTTDQLARLKELAVAQQEQFELYGYKRFALMQAFRRLIDGNAPRGSTGLNVNAVKKASRELYLIDGRIAFERALLYAQVLASMNATQIAHLQAMKGKGFNSWPAIAPSQVSAKLSGLPKGTMVAVMTYAGDLFSWFAGSLDSDAYFCPERHGTYYGGFYIKDAPAVGHAGYGISEQLTATAGAAMTDASKGYVTAAQSELMSSLVARQKNNLYAGGANIVQTRTRIAGLLRGLLATTADAESVKAQVLALSATYGELDGENNHGYAEVFTAVDRSLTTEQRTKLAALRRSILSGQYADGTPFDYTVAAAPYLYSEPILDTARLAPYIDDTDYLFFEPTE